MRALITGASSGIGRDMAKYLAQKGWDLVVVARRTDRLSKLKEELCNVDVLCITADLSKVNECKRLYDETKDLGIDMLINNAGFGLAGDFVDTDLDTELMMVDTNVKALHILTKLFLKDFVKKDSGTILNVASIAGFMPGPLLATYYATKNYVLKLTQAISKELKKKHSKVKISALCPGPIDTEFTDVANVKFSIGMVKSEYVAKLAVDKALKGKRVILPGIVKFVPFLIRFIPQRMLMSILYKVQSKRQEN